MNQDNHMTGDYGPCVRHGCPHTTTRTVGSEALCTDHVKQLLTPIRARVFDQTDMDGVGRLYGVLRPEYGPLVGDLQCTTCAATWTGPLGELCWWCQRANEIMRDHQAELVLQPPDTNPDDARYPSSIVAWAERLDRAIIAELITPHEADRAYQRHKKDTTWPATRTASETSHEQNTTTPTAAISDTPTTATPAT